jgi:hypothetical protein
MTEEDGLDPSQTETVMQQENQGSDDANAQQEGEECAY